MDTIEFSYKGKLVIITEDYIEYDGINVFSGETVRLTLAVVKTRLDNYLAECYSLARIESGELVTLKAKINYDNALRLGKDLAVISRKPSLVLDYKGDVVYIVAP